MKSCTQICTSLYASKILQNEPLLVYKMLKFPQKIQESADMFVIQLTLCIIHYF